MTPRLLLITFCIVSLLHVAASAPQTRYSTHNSLERRRRSVFDTERYREIAIGVLLPVVEVNGKLFDQPIRAVSMAVDEINERSDILPNIRLRVVFNSTTHDRWQAMRVALWQLNVANVAAIIGGADTSEVKLIATITREAAVPLLSPLDVEFEPDFETLYPTLFRVGHTYDRLGQVIQDMLEQFGWRKVAVIHSDEDYGLYGVRYAIERARDAGYNNITSVYLEQPRDNKLTADKKQAIYDLRDNKFRIFVVVLHPAEQAAVLRVAAEAGMFASGFAWVITHCNYGTDLFNESTMDGIICIRQQINHTVTLDLWEKMQRSIYRGDETSMWLGSVYAYTAVHALSQAMNMLHNSITANTSDYANVQPTFRPKPTPERQSLLNVLTNGTITDQTGMSVLRNNHQTSNYSFFNYHNGKLTLFATRNADKFALIASNSSKQLVYFPGGMNTVPPDVPIKHYKTLNALVPISFPFTYYVNKTSNKSCPPRHDEKNCYFKGVAIELIQRVESHIGLKINLRLWSNSWNDLVKEVGSADNQWHLAVGSVTVTGARNQIVDFSSSIFDSGLRILVLKPEAIARSYFEFFQPFSWSVWLLILITLSSASGVIVFLDPGSVDTGFKIAHPNAGKWNCRIHQMSDAVYFVCCLFFGVHRADNINMLFARIYIIVLCFWVLIMVSSYTANMAAFVTFRQQDDIVTTYGDLQDRRVGCRNGTANWPYVVNELSLRNVVPIQNNNEALQKLRSGSIEAYIGDLHHVLGLAAENCDVVVTGPLEQPQKYAFPMKPQLWYQNQINKAIREAVEDNFVIYGFEQTLNNNCPPLPSQDDLRTITMEDIAGLFILAFGLGFLLIMLKGSYLFWRRCKRNRNKLLPL